MHAWRERFTAAHVARLATVAPDGAPHVVPITFAVDGDAILFAVDHKPKRTTDLKRLRNIAANPRVSVLVDHYADDWTALWWARADGEAEIRPPGAATALAPLAAKYAQYRERPPQGPVVAIRVARWSGWAAS